MHAFQTAALQQQVEMLEQQEPKLHAGKRFLQDQLAAEKRQLELIQMHLVDYNALLSSGLARRYTGIELQREEARNRGNIARFSGEMSNSEISLGEVKIRIQEARDTYQRRVMTELQETLQRIAEVETALPAARTTRELRLRQVGFIEESGSVPRRALFVTRAGEQKPETFAVTDDAPLEPGDILRVERLRDRRPSAEAVSITWR
jgi:polysaccharide export outer membrane protein